MAILKLQRNLEQRKKEIPTVTEQYINAFIQFKEIRCPSFDSQSLLRKLFSGR